LVGWLVKPLKNELIKIICQCIKIKHQSINIYSSQILVHGVCIFTNVFHKFVSQLT